VPSAALRIYAPAPSAALRTYAPVPSATLRTSALFLCFTCGPEVKGDFQTSSIPQTIRSTDLIMRQVDIDPSVDSRYKALVSP